MTIIVRLNVPLDRVQERLRGRESGESLAWHLHRSGEFQQLMSERGIGDVVVSVDDEDPKQVASIMLDELQRYRKPTTAK